MGRSDKAGDVVLIGMLLALTGGAFYLYFFVRGARSADVDCMVAMYRVAAGVAPDEGARRCPAADRPVVVHDRGDERLIACPGTGDHVFTQPRFRIRDGVIRFEQRFGSGEPPETFSDDALTITTRLERKASPFVVRESPSFLFRWFVWPALLFACLAIAVWMIRYLYVGRREVILRGWIIGPVLVLLFLCAAAWFGRRAVLERTVTIPAGGGEVRLQRSVFGRPLGEPVRLRDVQAVFPVDGEGDPKRVHVLYLEDGEPRTARLFDCSGDDYRRLGAMHRALFAGGR